MAAGLRSKLDMKHGFMQKIIQNQVDSAWYVDWHHCIVIIFVVKDTYDKEVKAKLLEKPKHKQNKQKKPDLNVYVPPTKHKEMFVLEFEDKDGSVYKIPVCKDDSAREIAQKIGEEKKLPSAYIAALERRLEHEISLREGQESDPNS
uniref:UPF0561 protein C2orf68 homolog isoform X1 n=1 Tax=Crassostrea virginica TaxID=6565 RepID=A0A8B8CSA3_CRAVI|nr:UPF0561 protein C2orf68 homolog isoform X1 [Crassostrea virginica]